MAKGLAISGGATKVSFLAGAAIEMNKVNDYQIYSGISAGSIINLLLPIGEYDILKESVMNSSTGDLFSHPPLNNKDNITLSAIWRVITGKNSLGDFTLKDLLKKYYKPEHHVKMQSSGKIVKVGATNYDLMKVDYCDITKVDYDTALNWVVASSSIPMVCQPVSINNFDYYDGGVMEHVSGLEVIRTGATELDVIFSRPQHMDLLNTPWTAKNVLEVAMRTFNIMSKDISAEDEYAIRLTCQENKIPLNIIYPSAELESGMYEMNTDLMTRWWSLGHDAAINLINNK